MSAIRPCPEPCNIDELHGALAAAMSELAELRMRMRRQADEQEMALEKERARIAQEIHDGLAQHLALLSLKLEMVSRLAGRDRQRMLVELRNAVSILESTTMELRRCTSALRPSNDGSSC